ncbi:MAG: hypothetical protein ABIH17_03405 [Pseudomonadota bacterium]
MTYTSDTEIERITRGLADRTLPVAEWTHAAHFAAALWLVAAGYEAAQRDMPGMIRAYNESVGGVNSDTEGYHETITQASLRAARFRLDSSVPGTPMHHVHRDLMAGECGQSGWLLAYWSKPVLFSAEARRGWVEPDLQPLPFDLQA